MPRVVELLAATLVFSFVLCCVASALLQVRAWSRHVRDNANVSFRALWNPEAYFDPIGLRQIVLARRLLTIGGVAYLTYGLLIVLSNVL